MKKLFKIALIEEVFKCLVYDLLMILTSYHTYDSVISSTLVRCLSEHLKYYEMFNFIENKTPK